VKDIYEQLGPAYFKRAYRMKYHSFKKLARKLHHGIIRFSLKSHFVKNYWYVPMAPSHHPFALPVIFAILQVLPPMIQ
jgi:hypothetical protein